MSGLGNFAGGENKSAMLLTTRKEIQNGENRIAF